MLGGVASGIFHQAVSTRSAEEDYFVTSNAPILGRHTDGRGHGWRLPVVLVTVILLGFVLAFPVRYYFICERFETAGTEAEERDAFKLDANWVMHCETNRINFFDGEGRSLGDTIAFLRVPSRDKWERVVYVEIVLPCGFSAKRMLACRANLDYLIGA
jgi:hypothetical protein